MNRALLLIIFSGKNCLIEYYCPRWVIRIDQCSVEPIFEAGEGA
ncbi:MAG: hypothetical protein WBW94_06380 [Anaerolineales bacterium]